MFTVSQLEVLRNIFNSGILNYPWTIHIRDFARMRSVPKYMLEFPITIIRINEGRRKREEEKSLSAHRVFSLLVLPKCTRLVTPHFASPTSVRLPRGPCFHSRPACTLPPPVPYRTWRPLPRCEAVVVVFTRYTCIVRTGSLLPGSRLSREQYHYTHESGRVGARKRASE